MKLTKGAVSTFMKIETMKRAQAGYVNTPLEPMRNLSRELDANLYIKRDDLTGLALGGNKARKLDYIVQYALDNGYTALMTFGGVQTNHGRLTVAAAIRHGLKPILVLKGPKTEYMSGNVLLDRLMGADIYFVDSSAADALPPEEQAAAKQRHLDDCVAKIIADYESRGDKVLSIPVGGQTVEGSAGYIQAVPELMRQMAEQNISARYLVVGYGSTGTFAGLWAGAKYYNAPFEVIGIPIEPDYRPVQETVDFINALSEKFELGFTCRPEDLHLESVPRTAPTAASATTCPTPSPRTPSPCWPAGRPSSWIPATPARYSAATWISFSGASSTARPAPSLCTPAALPVCGPRSIWTPCRRNSGLTKRLTAST